MTPMAPVQLIALILTILFTAFFAGMETAFFSANKLSIELKRNQGKRSGLILSRFLDDPARLVGVLVVGLNIMLVLYGTIVFNSLQPFWKQLLGGALDNPYLKVLAEILLSSFLILSLGEFIPRSLFRAKADSLLQTLALPLWWIYTILSPLVDLMVSSSEWMLKYLLDVRVLERKQLFNKVEMNHFIRQNPSSGGEGQELNTALFEKALGLTHVRIRECMVPRKEIEALDIRSGIQQLRKKFVDSKLSKLIIYDGHIDNILGFVHQLDLFIPREDIRSVLHPIPAVPETMGVIDLLGKFSQGQRTIAWVVDEFGGTSGIVTLEDVLEELFGEIQDEHDTYEFVEKQIADHEFLFSGRLELDYLNERFGLQLPENESETLSGFIISHYGRIPKQKERIIIGDFEFDILNMTETRIEMVKLKKLT